MSAINVRRYALLAALAVLALFAAAVPGARVSATGESFTLKPSSGPAGTNATANGSGFQPGASVDIVWAGADKLQGGKVDADGTFALSFTVPDTKAGDYSVTACAYFKTQCDSAKATTTFKVTGQATPSPTRSPKPTAKPTPTPTKSANPTPTPTRAPSPTPTTTPSGTPSPIPTPTPTPTPIFSHPPIDQLAAVPWLNNGNGSCTTIPFAQPYRLSNFETFADHVVSGRQATVPSGARSGTLGISSIYDDFGSANKPIVFDFSGRGESQVALFVGRETPAPGAGPLTAVLTAYGWLADGSVTQVATASRVLEEAAISTTRCLHVTAPSGTMIRSVSVEYYDQDGASAYERRWVDDLVLSGATAPGPLEYGARGQVTITGPVNGSVVTQLASQPLHVQADVRWYSPSVPTASIRVNRIGATNGSTAMSIHRAPDGDATHWIAETNVTSGLVNDVPNELAVFVRGTWGSEISDVTNVTLAAPVAGNLRVVGIEVNQAVQVPGNQIPLIAAKRTVVRVFVQGTPDSRGPWGQITGQLTTTTAAGVTRTHNPTGPTTPLPGPISTWGTDSQLIFMLDSSETAVGALTLQASVRPLVPRPQTNTTDDQSTTSVNFVGPVGYSFYGVLFSFPDGSTNTWSKLIDFSHYLENVFPVSYVRVLEVPGIGETPQMVSNIDGLRAVTGDISSRLGGVDTFGLWPGDGLISSLCHPDGMCETGLDLGHRTDGLGRPSDGPSTMAQELSHAAGLMWHAETPMEPAPPPFGFWNPAWPWYHTSVGHPGVDTRDPTNPRVVVPFVGTSNHTHDYMSYAGGTKWVSPYTYCTMLDSLSSHRIRCPDGVTTMPSQQYITGTATPAADTSQPAVYAAAHAALTAPGPEADYLMISGQIAWDAQSATLAPIEVIRRTAQSSIGVSGDAFTLEIRDATGSPLASIPFSPALTHFSQGEAVPFELTVPRPDGAASVVILLGSQILGRRDASAHPPTLTIASAPSGTLSSATQLAFDASDADSDALTYTIEMSFDNRTTWVPVAVGLDQPLWTIDPASLPGSDNAWLRVQASDGFDTAVAESGPFQIPPHAPSILLDSPSDAITVGQGSPLLLQVQATDLEDGPLTGNSISWTSDRDGALGAGEWLVVETLSVGEHVITARATDSDGTTADVQVHVVVTDQASAGTSPSPALPPSQAVASALAPLPTPIAASGSETGGSNETLVVGTLVIALAGLAAIAIGVLLRRRRPRSG